jgi:hypothetical protein
MLGFTPIGSTPLGSGPFSALFSIFRAIRGSGSSLNKARAANIRTGGVYDGR